MEISQKLLAVMMAASAAVGAALGLLWDCVRLFRSCASAQEEDGSHGSSPSLLRRVLHAVRAVRLFYMDVLFGLICGLSAILLLYYTNDGQFRLSALAGMAGGFAAWQYTVGRLNRRLSVTAAAWLHKLRRAALKLCVRPFAKAADAHRRKKQSRERQAAEPRKCAVPEIPEKKRKLRQKNHTRGAKKGKAVRCI